MILVLYRLRDCLPVGFETVAGARDRSFVNFDNLFLSNSIKLNLFACIYLAGERNSDVRKRQRTRAKLNNKKKITLSHTKQAFNYIVLSITRCILRLISSIDNSLCYRLVIQIEQ